MSNIAFDSLARAQDISNAKATIANMEAALATPEIYTQVELDYCRRALPLERRRLKWLRRNCM